MNKFCSNIFLMTENLYKNNNYYYYYNGEKYKY